MAFILPHFEYCVPVLVGIPKSYLITWKMQITIFSERYWVYLSPLYMIVFLDYLTHVH